MERGQTDDRPNLIKKPVAKPGLLVSTPRAREEGKKGDEGAPGYDTSVQGHIKKEELPAITKASRDTQGGRKGKKRKKERKREGEAEREREGERQEREKDREGCT